MVNGPQVDALELSEIERLRIEVQQVRQERDQAYEMLRGLGYLGPQISFWDGTPERLPALVEHIRQAFNYRIAALLLFEASTLRQEVIAPADAHLDIHISPHEIERAILEKRPFIASNLVHRGNEAEQVLVVPLITGMQRVGILELVSDGSLPPMWSDLWYALGPQIASLVVGGRLLDQLERARRRHQLLYEISRHLTSHLNMDKVLTDILALSIPYIGADNGSIMLLNDQMQVINHILVRQQLPIEEQHQSIQNVLESGLTRWVIDNRLATIVADTTMDERWLHLPDDSVQVRSVLAVPLLRGERIRGLLFLVHHRPNYFDQDHLSFMVAVADQSAITVENVFLLEQAQQRVNELSALNEIGETVSSLRLDDILHVIVERTTQALNVVRCGVFLLDQPGAQLVLCAVNRPDLAAGELNMIVPLAERPHIAEAVQIRKPVQIPDVFADERLRFFWQQARSLGVQSKLVVPLIARQRVIGAISLDRSAQYSVFTQNQIQLCQTIAHQAANAIENARLYEEVQQRAEHLSLVNMVSHDIGAILDINQLLWEIVRLIRETFDCYYVSIALIEDEQLIFKSNINYLYQSLEPISLSLEGEGEGISGWVAVHGQPLLVPDVRQDARYVAIPDLPDTRSELAVPLQAPARTQGGIEGEDLTIGVLNVESAEANAFSMDDLELLNALAVQISVAVKSARLFSRVREEQATLEALINGTGDAIIVTDTDGHILFFNPAAVNTFLGGEKVPPGSLFSDIVRNQALLALAQQASASAEIPLTDGRTFHANMTVVQDVGRVFVMQDITYLKKLDEMKSSFVSTVSHDLRSPLQVIQTSAELLPKIGPLGLDQRKEVEHILAVVRRISTLVQHLLDIGRIEAGVDMESELCSLNEIVAHAAGSLRPLAEQKKLDLIIELPKVLPFVRANSLRLEQVISNLVSNAIKFTSQGSVSVVARQEGSNIVIEVSDTGIGIPLEAQENLFQKFYRVKTPETRGIEGTGLGLTIVKSIVESYGGQIVCTSSPRLGSTFTVKFPISEDESLPLAARLAAT